MKEFEHLDPRIYTCSAESIHSVCFAILSSSVGCVDAYAGVLAFCLLASRILANVWRTYAHDRNEPSNARVVINRTWKGNRSKWQAASGGCTMPVSVFGHLFLGVWGAAPVCLQAKTASSIYTDLFAWRLVHTFDGQWRDMQSRKKEFYIHLQRTQERRYLRFKIKYSNISCEFET